MPQFLCTVLIPCVADVESVTKLYNYGEAAYNLHTSIVNYVVSASGVVASKMA